MLLERELSDALREGVGAAFGKHLVAMMR